MQICGLSAIHIEMSSPMSLTPTLKDRPILRWGLLVGFWVLVGVIFVGYNYLTHLNAGVPFPRSLVLWIVVGWLMWIPLTPLVIKLARRFPIERSRWIRRVALHVGLACIIVVVDVSVFIGIRGLAAALSGTAGPEAELMGETSFNLLKLFRHSLLRSFFFDLLIYMVIVAIFHALEYHNRYRERDLRMAQLEAQLAQAQVQALRMQLNPHFLFNTLHAISSIMDENVREARHMITDLSGLLRHALERAGDQELPLEEELAFLKRYLKIEETRFQDRLSVHLDVAEDARMALVPNLILQPLVENAIKHGVAPYAQPGRIELRIRRRGEKLVVQIEDSGPGLRKNGKATHSTGIGLKNTKERLKQLYGDAGRLTLQNLPETGCRAELEIPFHTSPEQTFHLA